MSQESKQKPSERELCVDELESVAGGTVSHHDLDSPIMKQVKIPLPKK